MYSHKEYHLKQNAATTNICRWLSIYQCVCFPGLSSQQMIHSVFADTIVQQKGFVEEVSKSSAGGDFLFITLWCSLYIT